MKHKAKKQFGQNFLTDKNLLNKIVQSANINNKDVIEIGPGKGALTNFLIKYANSVTAYEIDNDLKDYLEEIKNKSTKFNYYFKDFLTVDLNLTKEYHIVSNIPYNITSPIIFKILDEPFIKSATLMVQKEVSDRITSGPDSKDYNALSVIVQYFMEVEKLLNVDKKMFRPVPKVDSAVFKMVRKERALSLEKEKLFIEIVKGSFHQKRKTISNNLSFSFGLDKKEINSFLENININTLERAEKLDINTFLTITRLWPF